MGRVHPLEHLEKKTHAVIPQISHVDHARIQAFRVLLRTLTAFTKQQLVLYATQRFIATRRYYSYKSSPSMQPFRITCICLGNLFYLPVAFILIPCNMREGQSTSLPRHLITASFLVKNWESCEIVSVSSFSAQFSA